MRALEHFDGIAERVKQAPAVALLSDYDGTLTPIVAQPDLAILSASTRDLLHQLARCERMHVAVISGRALEDVESKVGLNLTYAGNHGLEIQYQQTRFREPSAAANAPVLQEIVASLRKQLDGIEGVVLQNKGLTASIHYRLTHPENEPAMRLIVQHALDSQATNFILSEGKKVIEIRPAVVWNKGTAALWILDHLPKGTLPVSLGDDTTDEDMFIALSNGITVSIGPRETTAARYHVATVEEAICFLSRLREVMACSAVSDPDQTLH